MKTKKLITVLLDMLWFASEESKDFKDLISSSSIDKSKNYFYVEVEKRVYKITVEEEA